MSDPEDQRIFIEFAKRGQWDQMEQLENDVDINGTDSLGNTALHWAASGGHVDAIDWLLEKGANIHATSKDGDTALHKAVWRKHPEAAKFLVEKGSRPDQENNSGCSPMAFAKTDELKRILSPELKAGNDKTPLQIAMEEAQKRAETEDFSDDDSD
eukprot:CAMPEP_0174260660 /NCGR_PEP_ID=MMETSP0439-20130205/10193_1 /TAXON_ID=0 /ORGANISM="Stereomyxa ramosa, Strain Chinc5" /LENGTH=155 /DNA_ID=CAMNT_0015344951 /DNA_START=49 /DNA_END=516 /DNA_ORIENTATION=+